MTIKILGDRILVEPITANTSTIITQQKEKSVKGRVIELGTHANTYDIKIGDTIMYDMAYSLDITLEGIKYQIVKEQNIFAII